MSTSNIQVLNRRPAEATMQKLETAIETTQLELMRAKRSLKPASFNYSTYWNKAVVMTEQQIKLNELELDKAKVQYLAEGATFEEFRQTDVFRDRTEAINIFESKRDTLKQQQEKACSEDVEMSAPARLSMERFVNSSLGFHGKERRRRDDKMQSDFRQNIIVYYDLQHPGGKAYEDLLWNVITAEYEPSTNFVASHIFSWRHEKATMGATFGQDKADELFSAENGLLLPSWLAEQFDNGFVTIRLDIEDKKIAISGWENSKERAYKLHVVDKERDMMNRIAYLKPQTFWSDLDGRTLSFKTDARPRVQYLYFHDTCQHVRLAWRRHSESLDTITEDDGKFGRATWGRYISRKQMKALKDEFGKHPREEGAVGDADVAELDNLQLKLTLINQIEYTNKNMIQDGGESEEDEAEDSEVEVL